MSSLRRTTRKRVYDFFEERISKSAIQIWDDTNGYAVVGATCVVSVEPDGLIDVYICNPKNLSNGLGQKAVKNRLRALKRYDTSAVKELDGEGWVQTRNKNLVLENIKLLGIRKRAEISQEAKLQMLGRLNKHRKSEILEDKVVETATTTGASPLELLAEETYE